MLRQFNRSFTQRVWHMTQRIPLGARLTSLLHIDAPRKVVVVGEHTFAFRSGTNDEAVFRAVYDNNEYRLPASFRSGDVVVDIGLHIGSFSFAALQRGAAQVYGYEPARGNYRCAVKNLRPFGQRVKLRNMAVWRSDTTQRQLMLSRVDDNLAGMSLIWGNSCPASAEEVRAVPFDDVVREVTSDGAKHVALLKIDCEGSEFPILLTSHRLHLVDAICGEFHELNGDHDGIQIPEQFRVPGYERFTMAALGQALENAGLRVTSVRHEQSNIGLFFATREAG